MKKLLNKNIFILVGVLFITVASTHVAHAGFLDILLTPMDFFNAMAAMFFNLLLTVSSWLLSIAGFLLNVSIQLTLRIKDFVDHAPGIYTTWKAIRDISGIFLIFFLLYAAIQMIIGLESPGWGKLIRNIVMAGILINFSFFFAGLGIDLSNVISLQLYNAIAPQNSATSPSFGGTGSNGPSSTLGDGGIANIFMNSLKIPTIFDASKQQSANLTEANMNMGRIILIGVIGTIIMITSAFSFAAAALAFIARFVVLLFLLAFSPIWMLSIFPEVDKYVKMWKDAYKSMLIFMPIYLLLMYLAMNVLTTTPFFTQATTTNYVHWYDQFITLGINAALVIFLLNVPLFAAAAIAGKTGSVFDGVLNGAVKRFSAGTVWKGAGGWVGTRTLGMGAGRLDKVLANTRLGNTLLARDVRGATVGALAKNDMGYTRSYDQKLKDQKDVKNKSKEINRELELNRALSREESKAAHPKDAEGKEINPAYMIGKMNEKEKLALIGKNIKDTKTTTEVLKHMKGSDFEAAKKSDELSDEAKATVSKLRKEALNDAIANKQPAAIKNIVENMDGKDLLKIDDSVLRSPEVIEHLKPSQLKTMADEGISDPTKRFIGNYIENWSTPHKAMGYIRKNNTEWT